MRTEEEQILWERQQSVELSALAEPELDGLYGAILNEKTALSQLEKLTINEKARRILNGVAN